jgi:hypothetical protein
METIEEYRIIVSEKGWLAEQLPSLTQQVNAALSQGWQPLGAPFTPLASGGIASRTACCQAMVKFRQPTG